MRLRPVLAIVGLAHLGQGALATQAQSGALTWNFNADYTANGVDFSCSNVIFNVPSTGGSASFPCDIATVTATVNISALTFSVGGFGNFTFAGGSCIGTGGGSGSITESATTFSTAGTISGSGICTEASGSFPFTVTGAYNASAPRSDPGATAATVTSVTGDVRIIVDGIESPVTEATLIPDDAVVKTGANGRVELTFDDGSQIRLGPNSEFAFEPSDDSRGFLERFFRLIKGRVRALIQCGGQRYCANIRTTAACACVRGTNLAVEHKQGDTIGRTTVTVFSGIVDVIDNEGNITVVAAGQQVTVPNVESFPWLPLLLDD